MEYDSANRPTSLTLPSGVVTSYGYDDASQLTSLTYSDTSTILGGLAYAYDPIGNRTAVSGGYARTNLPAAVATTAYNDANQLTAWGTASLSYDPNGNLTSDGGRSYGWDSRNTLVSINSGATAAFVYDAFGRRVSKTVSGTSRSFVYDGENVVREVIAGTDSANFLSGGIDEVFRRTDSAGSRDFLRDALGSTVALVDSGGAVQTEYTYEPFGTATLTGASTTNRFSFTGREFDDTGLYYYRARYYDPRIGRFLSEDPIGPAGGVNYYAYVDNDPVNGTDPLGLIPLWNRSERPIPIKPEGADNQPAAMCAPGAVCNVDGVYSPPGSGKQCAVKIPDNCIAVVTRLGELAVYCIPFWREPQVLPPRTFSQGDFKNWPDPYSGRDWPWDPWDPNKKCECTR